jgi:hypothetical protein
MTMFDEGPMKKDRPDDPALDALLAAAPLFGADDAYRARLLADFDAQRRASRTRPAFTLFADAFGWRALARPLASAGMLAGLCATGFIAGAVASANDGEAYAALSEAFDQSFDLSEENASWAEE